MASLTIPKIFSNLWFWFALLSIIIAIHYFWGKTPPPPKPSKFLTKYKKTINKLTDIFIILLVLLFWLLMISFPVSDLLYALSERQYTLPESFHFACATFFVTTIMASGLSAFFIGFLSVFRSNLTRIKRLVLLIISLLPMSFVILALLIEPIEDPWSVIKLGLLWSLNCWVINGPAIIIGKHFLPVAWTIMRALRLVTGDYPG